MSSRLQNCIFFKFRFDMGCSRTATPTHPPFFVRLGRTLGFEAWTLGFILVSNCTPAAPCPTKTPIQREPEVKSRRWRHTASGLHLVRQLYILNHSTREWNENRDLKKKISKTLLYRILINSGKDLQDISKSIYSLTWTRLIMNQRAWKLEIPYSLCVDPSCIEI
jgi:hypothetical protein